MNRAMIYDLTELMLTGKDTCELISMTVGKLTAALEVAEQVASTGSELDAQKLYGILRDVDFGLSTSLQELDYAMNGIG